MDKMNEPTSFQRRILDMKKEACPHCKRLCFNCLYGIPDVDTEGYDCAFEFIEEMYEIDQKIKENVE